MHKNEINKVRRKSTSTDYLINVATLPYCNVAILAQSSADIALTYNFKGTHILGASCGHLCDSMIFLSQCTR